MSFFEGLGLYTGGIVSSISPSNSAPYFPEYGYNTEDPEYQPPGFLTRAASSAIKMPIYASLMYDSVRMARAGIKSFTANSLYDKRRAAMRYKASHFRKNSIIGGAIDSLVSSESIRNRLLFDPAKYEKRLTEPWKYAGMYDDFLFSAGKGTEFLSDLPLDSYASYGDGRGLHSAYWNYADNYVKNGATGTSRRDFTRTIMEKTLTKNKSDYAWRNNPYIRNDEKTVARQTAKAVSKNMASDPKKHERWFSDVYLERQKRREALAVRQAEKANARVATRKANAERHNLRTDPRRHERWYPDTYLARLEKRAATSPFSLKGEIQYFNKRASGAFYGSASAAYQGITRIPGRLSDWRNSRRAGYVQDYINAQKRMAVTPWSAIKDVASGRNPIQPGKRFQLFVSKSRKNAELYQSMRENFVDTVRTLGTLPDPTKYMQITPRGLETIAKSQGRINDAIVQDLATQYGLSVVRPRMMAKVLKVGAGAMIGLPIAMDLMAGAVRGVNTAMSRTATTLHGLSRTEFGSDNVINNARVATERQRAIDAIQNGQMNARYIMGSEAMMYH